MEDASSLKIPAFDCNRCDEIGTGRAARTNATIRAARRRSSSIYSALEVGVGRPIRRSARLGQMRCCFLKDGHIQQVMALPGLSAEEAIEQSKQLFESVSDLFDDFELWKEGLLIYSEDLVFRSDP